MEIGLREWLIVIGIVVIAGILFDGWRRMRGGKGKLKFRLDRSFSNLPDEEETSAELLGPPRVLDTPHHKEPQLDEHDLPSVSMPPREKGAKRGKRGSEPSQGDLNLNLDLEDDGPSLSAARDDPDREGAGPQRGEERPRNGTRPVGDKIDREAHDPEPDHHAPRAPPRRGRIGGAHDSSSVGRTGGEPVTREGLTIEDPRENSLLRMRAQQQAPLHATNAVGVKGRRRADRSRS